MELNINDFKNALNNGKVSFSYTKKDGSTRVALGTLNSVLYGDEHMPKGTSDVKRPENQLCYFDLNAEGWRSFLTENLISWEAV